MLDVDTRAQETVGASSHGEAGATTESVSLATEPWWATAQSEYKPIVPVDPAIYGIDDDEQIDIDDSIDNGTKAGASALPFLDEIQTAFGPRHDLGLAVAHTGSEATDAADAMDANAFATGTRVVFGGTPDLWTTAHEATHLVQQNAGIRPSGGIGAAGDEHEQRADAVADLVVSGGSPHALLADYLPFTSDRLAAPSGSMLQLDRKADTGPAPAPVAAPGTVSDASAFAFLKDGEDAVQKYEQGVQRANLLYELIKKQATMKATHEQVDATYKDVSKQREEMLEVSTFTKMVDGVTAVIDFATSVSGLISAARTLHAGASLRKLDKQTIAGKSTPESNLRATKLRVAQKGKSQLKAAGDLVKDGIDVGTTAVKVAGGEDPDAKVDTDTMLANANAAAIDAGNAALIAWVNAASKLNFQFVHESGADAALDFKHMVEGIALLVKGGTPLSGQSFERYQKTIDKFETARSNYVAALERVRALFEAYQAGGAAGLADKREFSVYEAIQKWKATNDPKAKALRLALDQDAKSVHFGGTHTDVETTFGGGSLINYFSHQYSETVHRTEDATLYVSDGAAATELMKLGLSPAMHGQPGGSVGESEQQEDKAGGMKLSISASIAKALESLGIPGTTNHARVQFHSAGGFPQGSVSNKQKGAWYDNWRLTPEFAAFWRDHLGGQYAYLTGPSGKRETIPSALSDTAVMSRSEVLTLIKRH